METPTKRQSAFILVGHLEVKPRREGAKTTLFKLLKVWLDKALAC
jgi:hypothetical protein